MTNEEALKRMKWTKGRTGITSEEAEAIGYAIEKLSNSDEDCISRADLISLLIPKIKTRKSTIEIKDKLIPMIKSLNPIQPKSKTEWIPVSERLPEELEPVNITWINRNPESYYADIKDKPFTATGVYFNGQWYWWSTLCTDILAEYSHNYDDTIHDDIEITAWMPLPKPYKAESEDKE